MKQRLYKIKQQISKEREFWLSLGYFILLDIYLLSKKILSNVEIFSIIILSSLLLLYGIYRGIKKGVLPI